MKILKKVLKNYFIKIIFILQLNVNLIKATTTELEMDRVCSSGDFDNVEHKGGYKTIQHYADDDNIELSIAHPFYRSLFMEGKKSNLILFINSIGLELAIEALAIVAFFNYFLFLCIWSGHCCLFKKLTDKQKLKKQRHCKYCTFVIMLIYFFISLALSVLGILFISYYKKAMNLSDCGLLRFTNHGLYGIINNYAGVNNLKDSFLNSSYSLNKIDTFYSRLFPYYDNIISKNGDFNTKMSDCNPLAVVDRIPSPNPDTELFDYITMNYQSIYGPKTDEKTILGIINKKYEKKIKPIVDLLTDLKSNFESLKLNKDAYISELLKYYEYFEKMEMMYESINRNIGKVYSDYMNSGIKIIYNLAIIFYFIFPILIIFLVIFIFIYICKKEATIFIKKYVRIIIHVLWNVIFVFSCLSLVLSGYIGTYRKYSYDLISSFNHLISRNIIINQTSEENLFIEFTKNPQIAKSLEIFNACYNSTQSTNIANILGIRDYLLYYFDLIYKNYNSLLKYVYNNDLGEDISTFITEKKVLLDTYLNNISKTTSYETHLENDFSRYIKELNKYTNYGDKNTYQINCVTNRYDIWVTNRDDCPSGYTYSIDNSFEITDSKKCLLLSDWTFDMYNLRYKPTCKTKTGEVTRLKVNNYLNRLKEYENLNKNLIRDMKNGADDLLNLHDELIDNINLELRNDNDTFLNFTLPFSMFTNDTSIYSLFDCGILKDDLIDFYDFTRHKLSTNSIMHIIFLLMISIFNIAAIYILIKILYVFHRTPFEEDISISEQEEDEIKDIKRKRYNNILDDKDLLSINKKNKASIKGSNKGTNKGSNNGSNKETNKKSNNEKIDNNKKTKAKTYAGFGKNRSDDETPSSSDEKLRTTQRNFDNKSSEIEENESDEDGNGKKNKGNKDLDTSNDEEIESGIRDDGSAMS